MDMFLSSIADLVEGTLVGDGDIRISGVASFENARNTDITFAGDARYIEKISETRAGAVLVSENAGELAGDIIYVENPRAAFVKLMNLFNPPVEIYDAVHPSVCIGENYQAGHQVELRPGVVIGDNVTLGDRVLLYPNVVIGDGVSLGDDVILYPNVTILGNCIIGSRVVINSGTVIGSEGYGFAPEGVTYTKIPHHGIVRIGDDVELGACNTIDRATYGETWIKNGVKTDNQVHIAHNVVVGENTLLVAQVGIAGSTTIGDHAVLAGQVGVAGHIKIGNNAIVGPKAGVLKSVKDNEVVSGIPAIPHKLWLRVQNILSRLPELKKNLGALEKRINKLEEKGE